MALRCNPGDHALVHGGDTEYLGRVVHLSHIDMFKRPPGQVWATRPKHYASDGLVVGFVDSTLTPLPKLGQWDIELFGDAPVQRAEA